MLFFHAPVPSHTQTRPQTSHGMVVAPPCWAGAPPGRQKCLRNSLAHASTASLDQIRPPASSTSGGGKEPDRLIYPRGSCPPSRRPLCQRLHRRELVATGRYIGSLVAMGASAVGEALSDRGGAPSQN